MYREARGGLADLERGITVNASQLPPPSDTEMPALILAHNLYGVDVDGCVPVQLALALYSLRAANGTPTRSTSHSTGQPGVRRRPTDQQRPAPTLLGAAIHRPKLQQQVAGTVYGNGGYCPGGQPAQAGRAAAPTVETYQPPTIR